MKKLGLFILSLSLCVYSWSQDCPASEAEIENGTLPADNVWNINTTCSFSGTNAIAPANDIIIANGGTLNITTTGIIRIQNGVNVTVQSGGVLNIIANGAGTGNLAVRLGGALTVDAGGIVNVANDLQTGNAAGTNTGTLTINGTVNVSGDYNLNAMGILDGSGTLTVTGNINDNGGDDSGFTGSDTCSGTCDPLPVELVSFGSEILNSGLVSLLWSTASEVNNKGFEVEKSLDASNFEMIGFVPGSGTINDFRVYEFTDFNFTDQAYYRLKQVDFDGQFEYGPTILATSLNGDAVGIYPTVITKEIKFTGNQTKKYSYIIVDISGKVRASNYTQMTLMNIQKEIKDRLGLLEPSTYFLKLNGLNESLSFRFIKE